MDSFRLRMLCEINQLVACQSRFTAEIDNWLARYASLPIDTLFVRVPHNIVRKFDRKIDDFQVILYKN